MLTASVVEARPWCRPPPLRQGLQAVGCHKGARAAGAAAQAASSWMPCCLRLALRHAFCKPTASIHLPTRPPHPRDPGVPSRPPPQRTHQPHRHRRHGERHPLLGPACCERLRGRVARRRAGRGQGKGVGGGAGGAASPLRCCHARCSSAFCNTLPPPPPVQVATSISPVLQSGQRGVPSYRRINQGACTTVSNLTGGQLYAFAVQVRKLPLLLPPLPLLPTSLLLLLLLLPLPLLLLLPLLPLLLPPLLLLPLLLLLLLPPLLPTSLLLPLLPTSLLLLRCHRCCCRAAPHLTSLHPPFPSFALCLPAGIQRCRAGRRQRRRHRHPPGQAKRVGVLLRSGVLPPVRGCHRWRLHTPHMRPAGGAVQAGWRGASGVGWLAAVMGNRAGAHMCCSLPACCRALHPHLLLTNDGPAQPHRRPCRPPPASAARPTSACWTAPARWPLSTAKKPAASAT